MIEYLNKKLDLYGSLTCTDDWHVDDTPICHRIYYVFGGAAEYTQGFKTITLKKNHLYFFPINKAYKIKHNISNPLKCLFLHIVTTPLIMNDILEIPVEKESELFYLLKTINSAIKTCNNCIEKRLLKLIDILLYDINDRFPLEILDDNKIIKVLFYIQSNYHRKLTNQELSQLINFNTNYFINIFKKTMGISPQTYVDYYRIRKSIEFILNGYNVKETAYKVGYLDSKAFSRFFKKHTGIPPSQYKKYYKIIP